MTYRKVLSITHDILAKSFTRMFYAIFEHFFGWSQRIFTYKLKEKVMKALGIFFAIVVTTGSVFAQQQALTELDLSYSSLLELPFDEIMDLEIVPSEEVAISEDDLYAMSLEELMEVTYLISTVEKLRIEDDKEKQLILKPSLVDETQLRNLSLRESL